MDRGCASLAPPTHWIRHSIFLPSTKCLPSGSHPLGRYFHRRQTLQRVVRILLECILVTFVTLSDERYISLSCSLSLKVKSTLTRMHSSRMRTARSLPYREGVSVRGGSLSMGVSAQGVSVWGISIHGGLCPRGIFSRAVSVPGGLCPGGLCPGGLCLREVSVQGGLCPGRSLSREVSVQGGLCLGSSLSQGFLSWEGISPKGGIPDRIPLPPVNRHRPV